MAQAADVSPWRRAAHIARTVRPPVIPSHRFNIIDFGACGDGDVLNTHAFARAIQACANAGGGWVEVPDGTFLTGAIHLKSNMEPHLNKGATILFSTNPNDYPLVFTRYEGLELINYSPLIYAYGERNIGITGSGTLDRQGSNAHWWPWSGGEQFGWRPGMPNQNVARQSLMQMAEDNVPVEKRVLVMGIFGVLTLSRLITARTCS